MSVQYADVYVEALNATTRSPLNVTFNAGGYLNAELIRVWLPGDAFWDVATETWLKVATAR